MNEAEKSTGGPGRASRHILMEGQVGKWVTSRGLTGTDSDDVFVRQ